MTATMQIAIEFYGDERFRDTIAHPQAYDWEVACNGYTRSYAQWVWRLAYSEARTTPPSRIERGLDV